MNLIIDIGNTRAKMAVFQEGKILKSTICYKEDLPQVQEALRKKFPKLNNGILANVATPEHEFNGALTGLTGKSIVLSAETPVPFLNKYETPETLGLDRIALAASAVNHYPNKNVLVIDAGTCITYDLITAKKEYLGGAISPGLNMRFRALNNFTSNLPQLRAENKDFKFPGRNTIESLHLGVQKGLIIEINGFIAHCKAQFPNLTVVLTGGDHEILSKSIKNTIFVSQNFLMSGLNYILEFNKS